MLRIVIVTVAAFAFACSSVCEEAAKRLDTCSAASTQVPQPPILEISNLSCDDQVALQCEAGTTTRVDLESWSKKYVDCDPDPDTCLCEGLPFICPDVYP